MEYSLVLLFNFCLDLNIVVNLDFRSLSKDKTFSKEWLVKEILSNNRFGTFHSFLDSEEKDKI